MPAIDVDFHDPRNSMLYWHPEIETLDVPTLQTEFFNLDGVESTFDLTGDGGIDMERVIETLENVPVEEIASLVEDLPTENAHIRADFKASRLAGGEGRRITAEPQVIHEQVIQLVDSMVMMDFPLRALAVREWVEVDTVATAYNSAICPEIRFIVDEGKVLGGFVDVYEDDFDRSFDESEIDAILDDLHTRLESDYNTLESWAKIVGEQLDDTGWSVDFIQDVNGEWYITDMALYGLYWNDRKNKWLNISHIPSGKSYNLEENPPDDL